MANLGNLRVYLTADTRKYQRGLTKAQKMTRSFSKAIRSTAMIAGAFTATIGLAAAALNRFASIGDDIGKGAKKIGVTAEEFQKLGFAARRSGSDIGAVNTAFKRMASTIFDAEMGLSEAKRALEQVGLTFQELKGRKPEEQFRIITNRLNLITDASRKAALAQDFFGRSGTELIPMIKNYKDLANEAERVGLITDDNVKAAEAYKDAMENLKTSATAFVMNTGLLEYMNELLKVATRLADATSRSFTPGGIGRGGMTPQQIGQAGGEAFFKKQYRERVEAFGKANAITKDTLATIAATGEKIESGFKAEAEKKKAEKSFADLFDMSLWGEFVKPEKQSENRLVSALAAGSREAFNLTVNKGEKTARKNLGANERTANAIEFAMARGIPLRDVGTVSDFN